MADTKITSLLTPQVTTNPATDVLPIVNIADTSMASSGSTRKITVNTLLGAGGTATLASATITGDLTVRTNRLATTTTGVGIGTASPNNTLTVRGTQDAGIEVNSADSNSSRIITAYDPANTRFYINSTSSGSGTVLPLDFLIGNSAQYRIAGSGVFTWYDGAGGTRMTLNSNGLGVGAGPSYKFHVQQTLAGTASAVNPIAYIVNNGSGNTAKLTLSDAVTTDGNITLTGSATAANRLLGFGINGVQQMVLDGNGNVGIGVTPSAWRSAAKALQVGGVGCFWSSASTTGSVSLGRNIYEDSAGNFTYIANSAALLYEQSSTGIHSWYSAAASTGTISFGSAKMTLDASGNLLVGTTVSPSGTKIGSIAKLGKVNVEGTNTVTVSTSVVALARAYDTGGLFFISGYNSVGGNQGWWLVASRGGTVTTIASDNGTGLTVAFTAPGSVLSMNTTSGTLSVSCISMTNQSV